MDLDELELGKFLAQNFRQHSLEKTNLQTEVEYSFDLDKLELSNISLAQLFRQESLEAKSLENKIFQKIFANISLATHNFFPTFSNNIHQTIYKKLDKTFAFNLFAQLHVQQLLLQYQL